MPVLFQFYSHHIWLYGWHSGVFRKLFFDWKLKKKAKITVPSAETAGVNVSFLCNGGPVVHFNISGYLIQIDNPTSRNFFSGMRVLTCCKKSFVNSLKFSGNDRQEVFLKDAKLFCFQPLGQFQAFIYFSFFFVYFSHLDVGDFGD